MVIQIFPSNPNVTERAELIIDQGKRDPHLTSLTGKETAIFNRKDVWLGFLCVLRNKSSQRLFSHFSSISGLFSEVTVS